ncbi:MAG: molybdopterin biosynthesis protein, partial [Caldilineaceae bacterium]|nr:molybdopterin biosynthesis protein [Caldilineaceae bacterium]
HYHAAAMDGYAVAAERTHGATETSPKRLVVGVDAMPVDTGDPLPPGTNAVIMIEETQLFPGDEPAGSGGSTIEIMKASPPWQYVRPLG